MNLQELLELYYSDSRIRSITEKLSAAPAHLQLKGLAGSSAAFICSTVFKQSGKPFLAILSDKETAAYFLNDLENLVGENTVLFFPTSYKKAYQHEDLDNANVLLRAEVLNAINKSRKPLIIVTYPEALAEKVVTKKHLTQHTLELSSGEKVSLDFITDLLFEYGFEHVDYVFEPGQYSIRGGIVDVYSFSNDYPYRIEFFGDEVDSIRSFNPIDQLSVANMQRITIVPNVQTRLLRESRTDFLEYIPQDSVIWLQDLQLTKDRFEKEFELATQAFGRLETAVRQLPPEELYTSAEAFAVKIPAFSTVEFGIQAAVATGQVTFNINPQPTFNKNFDLLTQNLQENTAKGYHNLIFADTPRQVERIHSIFEDIGKNISFTPLLLSIHEGLVDKDLKLACYTDHQIFDRYHKFKIKSGFKKNEALTLKELYGLTPGDFVAHIDHGIGRFAGLEKIDVNGKMQEAIRLVYKDNDMLYVSIHSLHKISKYVGKEGTQPSLNKLGSNAWNKLKQKTKKKVKEIAYDLIKLYAKRKATKGFAFFPDTYLQNELEASFIYEDTPDQEKATADVKRDMEASYPMDRLICGDVGFGKTEIAIRAAFKAATDNKQVAILVPTTILALQHYKTFKERLKDFPCKVDYINRFKSVKEQKETLKKTESGEIDILIGTHRIAAKDVKFKDLGLLIIDEEQKFGVGVKDKLKTIKANVDALTLTATPIPRTLQFSLMGARDLTVINTPPPNRYPVQTEIHGFNEEIIRDAVNYEVARGGQVFFVHNRVQSLPEISGLIQRLCPDVKVARAHGQMEGDKLEEVMQGFIEGYHDVLVTTTIIEAGLDISNANTIIINNAHNFGLSDLHQMRGRVGRSNKKAFCYLLAPPLSVLTPEARKRLSAIEQFSDLGSGFQIAMRDLDIRGAGDILGAEQSGFISEIGYDMYQKILNEAIQELKEEEFKDLFKEDTPSPFDNAKKYFVQECQIDTDLEILIPDDYVSNITERLNLYKELDNLEEEEELQAFTAHLKDRFGEVPRQTLELIDTIRLRKLAKQAGFEKLLLKNNRLVGYFIAKQDSPFYQSESFTRVLHFVQKHPEVKIKEVNQKLTIIFEKIKTVEDALHALKKLAAPSPVHS